MNDFVGAWHWLTTLDHWQGQGGILTRLFEHLALTAASVGLACALVLPLALWLGHLGRGGTLAINVTNVGRAVPVYAILVLLVLGPLGSSTWSIVIALTLFAIPPVMTNTYVGVREVDRGAVDAARGAGMSGRQVLARVELPLATPLIMQGVRLATVQVVATATLAALVAGGGLGRIITLGFANQDFPMLLAGAFLVAALALVLEGVFVLLQRLGDPTRRARRTRTGSRLRPGVVDSTPAGA